ncbi:MAG: hypothetical protein N3A54_01775 [Patescibacteria group bacterium]|nr:hypothetical protein [Patescibacteria group bacterium]
MEKYENGLFGRVKKNGVYIPNENLIKLDVTSYRSFEKNFLSVLCCPDLLVKRVNIKNTLSPIDLFSVNTFIEVEFQGKQGNPKGLVIVFHERQKMFRIYMTSQLYEEALSLEKKTRETKLLSGFELHTSQKYTFPHCVVDKAVDIPLDFNEYFSSENDKIFFVFSIILSMLKETAFFSTYTMTLNGSDKHFYYGISKTKAFCISDTRNLEYEYYKVKPFSDLVYFNISNKEN